MPQTEYRNLEMVIWDLELDILFLKKLWEFINKMKSGIDIDVDNIDIEIRYR